MNYGNEFNKYAVKHLGMSSNTLNDYEKYQQITGSQTPYILEPREMRFSQMDVFSRLLMDRIIWVCSPVESNMASIIQAQLLFLDSMEQKDITMYLSTPGGSCYAGLGIVGTMELINSDVATINTEMCASMGSVLLGAGTKGKRSALRFSRVMIHQSSSGMEGNIQDARVSMKEWERVNEELLVLLGEYTGKTKEQIEAVSHRDFWMSAAEAKEFGIIDEIVSKK